MAAVINFPIQAGRSHVFSAEDVFNRHIRHLREAGRTTVDHLEPDTQGEILRLARCVHRDALAEDIHLAIENPETATRLEWMMEIGDDAGLGEWLRKRMDESARRIVEVQAGRE